MLPTEADGDYVEEEESRGRREDRTENTQNHIIFTRRRQLDCTTLCSTTILHHD